MRRPYPSYRHSGVEWLGEVPEHWEVRRLGSLGVFFKGSGGTKDDKTDSGFPCIWYGELYTQHEFHITSSTARVAETDAEKYELLCFGDLLFAGSDVTPLRIGKSAVNLIKERAYCGADVIIFRPTVELDARFLGYASESHPSKFQKRLMGRGVTVMHIYGSELKNLTTPMPPLDEQTAIAAFLDDQTAKIDSLITKKRLLLDRLAEYRTALITRTVTKGLPPEAAKQTGFNPTPGLKISGVDWLGDVPEHWEVKRLEHVASYRTSSVDKKIENGELAVRLCNYTDVYYLDQIRASDGNFMQATASPNEISRFKLKVGDVLITKDSEDWTDIAVPALVEETADDFVCGYHLGIIRPNAQADPAFIYRAMQSEAVNRKFQVASSGVTRYGLPNSAVGEVLIPLPPLNEQRAIAAFLDHRTERISALFSRVEVAIERLQEYRMALIAAAVTGKIDVRDHDAVEMGASRT